MHNVKPCKLLAYTANGSRTSNLRALAMVGAFQALNDLRHVELSLKTLKWSVSPVFRSLIPSLTHSLTHSATHSLTPSLTHSLTDSLTDSLTPAIWWCSRKVSAFHRPRLKSGTFRTTGKLSIMPFGQLLLLLFSHVFYCLATVSQRLCIS